MSCLRASLRAKLRRMNSSLLKGNVGFVVACAVFAASPGWAEDAATRSTQELLRFSNADLDGPADAAEQLGLADDKPPAPEILLEWSENPGVYESDLRRRLENPLYVEARRIIDESELLRAKRVDAANAWDALEEFIGLLSDKKRMERYELASEMADALLRIDEATWEALRVGGEAYALATSIQKMRAQLMQDWRSASAKDPGVQALLDAEESIPTVQTESSAVRFLALIQAGNDEEEQGPISTNEFGTALMSEDPDSIRTVYESLQGELKNALRDQLRAVLWDVGREEIEFPDKHEKVAAVAELLEAKPFDFGIFETKAPL